jgi:hypothetical protein
MLWFVLGNQEIILGAMTRAKLKAGSSHFISDAGVTFRETTLQKLTT